VQHGIFGQYFPAAITKAPFLDFPHYSFFEFLVNRFIPELYIINFYGPGEFDCLGLQLALWTLFAV
jgi:hypothetical protein